MASSTPSEPGAEMRRAAGLSLTLAVGAAAALALATYLTQREMTGKAPIGPNLENVESWLKKAADGMRKGADSLIQEIDPQR